MGAWSTPLRRSHRMSKPALALSCVGASCLFGAVLARHVRERHLVERHPTALKLKSMRHLPIKYFLDVHSTPRPGDCAFNFTAVVHRERDSAGCRRIPPTQYPSLHGSPCERVLAKFKQKARRATFLNLTLKARVEILRWDWRLGEITAGACSPRSASDVIWPGCDGWDLAEPTFHGRHDIAENFTELTPDERWRVEHYLGALGALARSHSSSTIGHHATIRYPVVMPPKPICAIGGVLYHTAAALVTCADTLKRYGREMLCMRRLYARAAVELPGELSPDDVWLWRAGDSQTIAPALVKSRRIRDPGLSVLAPLNRHYHSDHLLAMAQLERRMNRPFLARERCLPWRGMTSGYTGWDAPTGNGSSRKRLLEAYFDVHELGGVSLDLGFTKLVQYAAAPELRAKFERYLVAGLPLENMAACRYQLAIEGNDVATNLKWALYTDSVVLMPVPTVETWLLEGQLRPWVHFVPVRDDFADLEAKLSWCEAHQRHASYIASAGRAHVLRVLGQGARSEERVLIALLHAYHTHVDVMPVQNQDRRDRNESDALVSEAKARAETAWKATLSEAAALPGPSAAREAEGWWSSSTPARHPYRVGAPLVPE